MSWLSTVCSHCHNNLMVALGGIAFGTEVKLNVERYVGISIRGTPAELKAEWFPMAVPMPCGRKYFFEQLSDVPTETIPCSCGDPMHTVIQYGPQ